MPTSVLRVSIRVLQKALNETRILLLGAGATGTETLKNLVLPGIGHITVVDDRTVTDDECKDNFFVTRAHVGQPLAKVRRRSAVCLGCQRMRHPVTLRCTVRTDSWAIRSHRSS